MLDFCGGFVVGAMFTYICLNYTLIQIRKEFVTIHQRLINVVAEWQKKA